MLYGLALQDRWPSLPANMLSTRNPEIDIPPGADRQLMVEPYIHVARSPSPPPPPPPPAAPRCPPVSASCIGNHVVLADSCIGNHMLLLLLALASICTLLLQCWCRCHHTVAARLSNQVSACGNSVQCFVDDIHAFTAQSLPLQHIVKVFLKADRTGFLPCTRS